METVRNEWVKAISLFKNYCHENLPQEKVDLDIAGMKDAEAQMEADEAAENAKGHAEP